MYEEFNISGMDSNGTVVSLVASGKCVLTGPHFEEKVPLKD